MSGAALYPDLDKVRFLQPERKRLFGQTEPCDDWERHLDSLVRDHGVRILVDRRGQSHVPLPAHAIDLDLLANRMCRVLTHETQRDHETPESVLALFSAGVVTFDGDGAAVFFCQPSSRTRPDNIHYTIRWWDGVVRQEEEPPWTHIPEIEGLWNAGWAPDESNGLPVALTTGWSDVPLLVQLTV